MTVLMQALAGHLGDLELASVTIANTVLVAFNYGLMVRGRGSCAALLLPGYFLVEEALLLAGQPPELAAAAGRATVWFVPMHFAFALLFPLRRFLQCQGKNWVSSAAVAAALCADGLATWLLVSVPKDLSKFLACSMTINTWEMAVPVAFLAGTGVRVATELGAGNWRGDRFATVVSSATSLAIGVFFCGLIVGLRDRVALIFTASAAVLGAVDELSVLLATTVLLNSIQPVLSGVAVVSGWQSTVAYVNVGCYYVFGVPLGVLLGWVLDLGVPGIWAGMIGRTAIQTLVLAVITVRCDWEEEAMIASTRMDKASRARKKYKSKYSSEPGDITRNFRPGWLIDLRDELRSAELRLYTNMAASGETWLQRHRRTAHQPPEAKLAVGPTGHRSTGETRRRRDGQTETKRGETGDLGATKPTPTANLLPAASRAARRAAAYKNPPPSTIRKQPPSPSASPPSRARPPLR
ncbi:Protein TRANSPARENT TESTA 12 -like protein [Panicum miliaceum]|uniref:Protein DETOXIFICATION n=1 Tax=Panicum miliaceum TaxID=4540 RepID=A0A3L6SMM3_PANMI|nr:Protein TRANSPARENT TESTA 12 -like protein [Panicum miliaceum]